jgi:hypothetical protein
VGDGKTQAEKPHTRRPPAPTIGPIADYDRTDVNGIADRPGAAADTLRRNNEVSMLQIKPELIAELQMLSDRLKSFAQSKDFRSALEKHRHDERWRTDPLELMGYFNRVGEVLYWRRIFWSIGDFFNSIGNIGL